MNKEIVYRGESKYFDHKDGFIPSLYRGMSDNYTSSANQKTRSFFDKYNGILLQLKKESGDNEGCVAKNRIRNLGILQHYGIPTPLLDVTSDRDIALFFACNGNFGEVGYVYSFDEKKMVGFDTVTVQERMSVIWENSVSESRMLYNGVFSFDYSQLFNANINNNRYQRQKGKFILHSYKKDGEKVIPDFVKESNADDTIKIDSKEKIKLLLHLALEKGITSEYLFPDSEKSIYLYGIYHTRDDKKELLELDEIKSINCRLLSEKLVSSFEGFVFAMTCLYEYSKYLNDCKTSCSYQFLIDECESIEKGS